MTVVCNTFRAVIKGLLDLIYPAKCVSCGDIQPHYICERCRQTITHFEPPVCAKCGMPVEQGPCESCRKSGFAFAGARAAGAYEGALRDSIHALKYSGYTAIAPELGSMLRKVVIDSPDFAPEVSTVIPVPIHSSRRRDRGFNQSELLARSVAEFLDIPMETRALVRSRATRPQVEMPVEARRENVSGAFLVVDESRVLGRRILLIDDVMTTGSTAHEASKVLRSAGSEAVYVLTLARSILASNA